MVLISNSDSLKLSSNFICLPFSVKLAKYYKSQERLIACGNQLGSNLAHLSLYAHENLDSTINFIGNCDSFELCESVRGSFAVLGVNNALGFSCLELVELSNFDSGSFKHNKNWMKHPKKPLSRIVSLAYDQSCATVSAGTESGNIANFDLVTGSVISDMKGDCNGITDLHYSHPYTLIGSGRTSKIPFRIWDLRVANGDAVTVRSASGGGTHPLSCLRPHRIDQLLIAGNTNGDVFQWDLRNLSSYSACNFGVHSSNVSDIVFHPLHSDQAITAGLDGRVFASCLNSLNGFDDSVVDYRLLLEESVGFCSLDVDEFSNTLLCANEIGPVFKLDDKCI